MRGLKLIATGCGCGSGARVPGLLDVSAAEHARPAAEAGRSARPRCVLSHAHVAAGEQACLVAHALVPLELFVSALV